MIKKKYFSILVITFCSLLMIVSCQDSVTLNKPTNLGITNYSFDGTEGDPITLEVATRWIGNYTSKNSGRINAHFFGQQTLKNALAKTGCMGIRFYYALDDSANSKVLFIGADAKGQNLLPIASVVGKRSPIDIKSSSTIALRATEGALISSDISNRWTSAYVKTNQAGIWAHFFGHEILNQILAEKDCIGIRAYHALNDSGVQQLLLFGVSSSGSNLLPASLNARVESDNTIADLSFPCPSLCSGS